MTELYSYSCKLCGTETKSNYVKDNICDGCAKKFGGKQFTLEKYGVKNE